MGVFKRVSHAILIIILPILVYGQGDAKSFHFENQKRSEIVKNVVESFGYYLSYKPAIFTEDSYLSLDFEQKTLVQILNSVLKPGFDFHLIGEYVAVTKAQEENIPKVATVQKKIETVYDTVRIEEKIIAYDTQAVVTYETVFDTVFVKQKVYDTIPVIKELTYEAKKVAVGAFVFPGVELVDSNDQRTIFYGAGLGIGAQYSLKKVKLQLNASYAMIQSGERFTEAFQVVEQQIDTVSQFFIIDDNGVSVPVYVVDTTSMTRDVERIFNQLSTRHLLNISFESGHFWELRKILLGASLGVVSSWVINQDERLETSGGEENSSLGSAGNHTLGFLIQAPIHFKGGGDVQRYISPFFSFSGFTNSNSFSRSLLGVRFGWIF